MLILILYYMLKETEKTYIFKIVFWVLVINYIDLDRRVNACIIFN